MDWMLYHAAAFLSGPLEYAPEFAIVSNQYWQDMFCIMCFLGSLKGKGLALQDQNAGGPGAPETFNGILNLKTSLHAGQCIHTCRLHVQ